MSQKLTETSSEIIWNGNDNTLYLAEELDRTNDSMEIGFNTLEDSLVKLFSRVRDMSENNQFQVLNALGCFATTFKSSGESSINQLVKDAMF
jgi:hypothetical protein